MFSGLASLLFGNSNSDSNNINLNNNRHTETPPSVSDSIGHRLLSSETDEDDWLLIDKEEEESLPQTDSEEELPFVEIRRSPTILQRSGTSRHQRVNSGGAIISALQDGTSQSLYVVSSSPANNLPLSSMEESWFLTPPPCFTSTGPVNMETSPFENLLIEHPSMSVYHSIRSAQEATESFVNLDLGMEDRRSHPIADRTPVRTVRIAPRTVQRVEHLNSQQAKEGLLFRNSQKIHDKHERQNLCRGALKRGNKVHDFNSRGNRKRRSDMQHCRVISGANNNRKC